MIKKGLIVGMLLLLIIPIVYSATVTETGLTINTDPDHDLSITVTNAETGKKVQSIEENSGAEGKVEANILSMNAKELNIEILAKKSGTFITTETFGPFPIGGTISIELDLYKEPEPEKNVTEVVDKAKEVKEKEEEQEKESEITGAATGNIGEKIKESWKTILIIIGVILVLIVIIFIIVKWRKKVKKFGNIIVKKQSEFFREHEEKSEHRELSRLQEKLDDLQAEINRFKHRDKIAEAEKKLAEEREKLQRMKDGRF